MRNESPSYNDTGKIEWIDCGYGYFDIYEENPNGILANSIQEFLEKFWRKMYIPVFGLRNVQ